MAYIDEDFVSANIYKGEKVPGPNTLTKAEWDGFLNRVTDRINKFLHCHPNDKDDVTGELVEISLFLFKKCLKDQPLEFGIWLKTMKKLRGVRISPRAKQR